MPVWNEFEIKVAGSTKTFKTLNRDYVQAVSEAHQAHRVLLIHELVILLHGVADKKRQDERQVELTGGKWGSW